MYIQDRVLNVFDAQEEPQTFNEVADKLGIVVSRVRGAVDNLRDNHGYRVEYYPEKGYYLPLPTPAKLFPA